MNVPTKSSILFVDDEENVLAGLGRMLRSRRGTWDLRFALGGQRALEMMAESPADVVVSDMRMPGMSGAELLSRVQKSYPQAVRIVLSGFAEKEAILKTIGPSHRYLAKPAAENTLVDSIENALRLRKKVGEGEVQRVVAGLGHLPTLPDVYLAILAELNSELGSADRLAAIIERDLGISTQIMKLTNSAYFNMPQHCTTVKHAIKALGFDNVRATVLLAGVFEQFKNISPGMAAVVDRLAQRSLALGVIAQAIARHEQWSSETADQAFCAGLLAHVGTLVLIANDADRFLESMKQLERGGTTLIHVEECQFGANHAQLGAYLLGLWGFTDAIVEAVAFHHQPSQFTERAIDVLTAVHIGQHLAREAGGSIRSGKSSDGLDEKYVRDGNLSARLPIWSQAIDAIRASWPRE